MHLLLPAAGLFWCQGSGRPPGTHMCTIQKYKGINLCPRTHLWLMGNGNQEINAFPFDFLDRELWDTSKSYGTRTMALLTVSTPIVILVLFPLAFHFSCPSFLIPWDIISWINYLHVGLSGHISCSASRGAKLRQ